MIQNDLENEVSLDTLGFFNFLFHNSTVSSIFILNPSGIIQDANLVVQKTFGYKIQDLRGRHFSLLFTSEDRNLKKPEIELRTVHDKGFATDYNYIVHKDGAYIWVSGESILVRDGKGQVFYIKLIHEVNEQKLLEKHLISSNELSEGIIDAMSQAVVVLDGNMRIIRANIEFFKTFDLDVKEINECSIFEVCKDVFEKPEIRKFLFEILDLDVLLIKTFELEYDTPNDGKRIISLNLRKILHSDKGIPHILIVFTDITVYSNANKKLISEKEFLNKRNIDLDTFVYTASHDLKAPINNIEGLIGYLKAADSAEESEIVIKMMEDSILKFKATLQDLSLIGEAQQAEVGENLKPVSFEEMLTEVKFDLKEKILDSKAILKDDFSKAPAISFSRKNLRSILYNLVSNAIKYKAPSRLPEVIISTEIFDNYIMLCVKDNGLGIEEKDKEKVFSMYKRLHDHVEGTGVGMNIVKRIVENNGGKIDLESLVGRGSTFKIFLKID